MIELKEGIFLIPITPKQQTLIAATKSQRVIVPCGADKGLVIMAFERRDIILFTGKEKDNIIPVQILKQILNWKEVNLKVGDSPGFRKVYRDYLLDIWQASSNHPDYNYNLHWSLARAVQRLGNSQNHFMVCQRLLQKLSSPSI